MKRNPKARMAARLGGGILLLLSTSIAGQAALAADSSTPAATSTAAARNSGTTKPVSATLSPAAFSFTEAAEQEDRDAVLAWQAEPADVGKPLTLASPADLPGGLGLAIDRIGSALVERDRVGQPTGLVRQRVRLRFTAIPRRLESQPILLAATLGKTERPIEISVTNLAGPPTGASLAVTVPTDLRWSPGQAIGLVLSAQGAPAPGVVFAAGPFVEAQTRRSAPIDLCLTERPGSDCADGIGIAANHPRNLFLRSRGGDTLAPGSYTGTLRFLAGNGLKVDQTVQLEVTSDRWRWTGLAALLLGTALSFLLTVLFPYRRDREFALRPFATLRDRLGVAATVRGELATPELDRLTAKTRATLQDRRLVEQGLIGSWLPSPYGGQPDAAVLKAHLDAQGKWVIAIERLTNEIVARPDQVLALDAVAGAPDLTPDNLDQKIDAALGAAGVNRRIAPLPSLTLAEIAAREEFRSGMTWFLSSLLSIALGYVILIDANPSFGGWTDVVGALLWALGLSVAGGKLAEVTSGQLRGVLRPSKTA